MLQGRNIIWGFNEERSPRDWCPKNSNQFEFKLIEAGLDFWWKWVAHMKVHRDFLIVPSLALILENSTLPQQFTKAHWTLWAVQFGGFENTIDIPK